MYRTQNGFHALHMGCCYFFLSSVNVGCVYLWLEGELSTHSLEGKDCVDGLPPASLDDVALQLLLANLLRIISLFSQPGVGHAGSGRWAQSAEGFMNGRGFVIV